MKNKGKIKTLSEKQKQIIFLLADIYYQKKEEKKEKKEAFRVKKDITSDSNL